MASLIDFYKQKLAPKITSLIDDWKAKPSNQIGNKLVQSGILGFNSSPGLVGVDTGKPMTEAGLQPKQSSFKPIQYANDRITNYINNTYLASARDLPKAVQQIKQPGIVNKAVGVGRLGFDVLGAVPDPTDALFAGYNYLKGTSAYGRQNPQDRNLFSPKAMEAGLLSATMEKPIGLGEAVFNNPTAQTIGNIAELPLILGAGVLKNKQISQVKREALSALKNEPGLINLKGRLTNRETITDLNQYIDEGVKLRKDLKDMADEVAPSITKALTKIEKSDPDLWMKQVMAGLEDRLISAKDPVILAGLQARPLKKLEEPVAQGGLGDIKPITAYHGSDTKIEKFDLNKVGSNTDSGMFGKGIYFSGSPKEASTYARNTGNVSEYQLNLKNPYVIKSQADIPDIKAIGTKEYSEKFTKYLQDRGFDGVIDEISPNKQYIVFDPKQISLSPSKGGVPEPKIVKPLKEVYKEKLTTGENIPQLSTPQETAQQISSLTQPPLVKPIQQSELPTVQRVNKSTKLDPTSESIIQEARKQIGESSEPPKANLKQTFDNLYTQWVDRYNPITQASKKAQGALKEQGAVLRPEYDPTYLVRRLTGAGGIADQRFQTQLNPILKEMEQLNIPKADMDVYLANRRIAGFGTAGRDIYGADPKKASEVVSALNAKYPNIDSVAQKFYTYQDEGLKEISDAGFLSPEDMAKIKSQNPDYSPLYRVMDEMDEYLGLPTRKTQQATSPITKIKGSTRQIESPVESIIGNTFRQRAAIEKNRVAQSIVNLQKVADMGFEKVAKSGTDTISVWNNGKKEFWKVGQDIADTAKGVNEESMNVVLKLLQAPASLLRQGATGRNPEFMTPNIIRDQLDAAVTSKYGYIPFVDYLSGLKSMLTNDEVYQKWANSGAKIDLGELSGKKSIKQLFDSKVQKKKLGGWISQGLDVLGKYSEQPTRVGLFKKAYNKTGNELIAALESRDATVDFARMGSKMKVANSIVPFLNVGVQGFDKLIRSVKDNPGKVAFNLSTYAVAPQVMSTMYNLIKYPEEYQEIPQYEKDANFVFVQGRNEDGTVNYITIPKGNIVPVAANPTQNFLEYAFSNNPQSFKEMALNTLSGTLPVLGQGSSLKEIGIKTIGQNLPQAIKPITENLLNKSFYKYDPKKEQNKDIVPSYLQNKPAYLQKYDFTPKMYEKIGAALNVSPLKVQNLMEGYLAGYSKIPAQILDSMNTISQGKEVSNNNKTILRRFVKTTYPSSSKPAPETPPVPSFMERITGKAGASEKAGKDKTYWYTDDSGNSKSIKIGKVTSLPESTNYERVKKDQEKWKLADDILNLPAEQQQKAFTDLGISKADAEYYQVAKDTTEAKVAYIKDQVQGVKTYEEFLKKVIPLAKEINGSSILSSGVIDWLYNNKIITSAQKKQLKSLEFRDGKVQIKSGTGSAKSTYVEAKLPASAKTALPKVKRIRTKQYKLVVPKAK